MLDLYLAELRRLRNGSAAFAAAHLVVLALLQQSLEISAGPLGVHLLMLCLYTAAGLGLAVFQFGSYIQPSRWIWLMHRPLHRGLILAALVLAAVTIAILAVALPLLLVLAAQAHYTERVIDQRHYVGATCLALAALGGWLGGGWVMLHRSRWAFPVFVLPVILCLHLVNATTVFALWLACDAALAVLLYTAFAPQRSTPPGLAAVPGALVLTLGFYAALLTAGTLLFDLYQLSPGTHVRAAGAYIDTMAMTGPARLRLGLAASTAPDAAAWRAGLSRANTQPLAPLIRGYAVPEVISSRGAPVFVQGEDKWTFSEDRRMYRGTNLRTGAAAGWFGTGGQGDDGRFDAQPVASRDNHGGGWMIDAHTLYGIDGGGRILQRAFTADPGEWLASGIAWAGPDRLLLTNRRLVLFDPAAQPLAIRHALALPLPLRYLGAIDTARVADGTLVSLLYGYRQAEMGGPSRQSVYLFTADGVREVGRRDLPHDSPALYEYRGWWISPAIATVMTAVDGLLDNGAIPDAVTAAPVARPDIAWIAALAAALLAGVGALWRVRGTAMPLRARLAWCGACLALGLPALLALLVMAPPRRPLFHLTNERLTPC